MFPADPVMNPLIPNGEQWSFVYQYYPDYQYNPVEIICWLYDTALYNENQEKMQNAQYAENAYNSKPSKGGRKMNQKNKNGDDSEEEEDDVVYFNK